MKAVQKSSWSFFASVISDRLSCAAFAATVLNQSFGLDCQDTTVAANQIPPKNPHNILVQLNPDVFGLFLTEVLGIVATVIINPISLIVI